MTSKDVFKTFLAKAKDHVENTCGLSIYVHFKLHIYYHSITRQTNCINLNKSNMLNIEITPEL